MKKASYFIYSLLLILFLTACASNQIEYDSTATETSVTTKNNKQTDKKLRFDDWKYMGFGYELPQWFEAALTENVSKVKRILPDLQDSDVKIFIGKGDNVDQSDSAAKEAIALAIEEGFEGYKLYENYWARKTDDVEFPYKSVYIYYKEKE
ncbi:MAG: hypothetical protein K6C97_05060 [Treponema sp.]|nr:hypothetical protein [Treponema sp.]